MAQQALMKKEISDQTEKVRNQVYEMITDKKNNGQHLFDSSLTTQHRAVPSISKRGGGTNKKVLCICKKVLTPPQVHEKYV